MKKKTVETGYASKLIGVLASTRIALETLEKQQKLLTKYYKELEEFDPHLATLCREADGSMIEPLNKLLRYVETKKEVAFAAPN